MSAKLAKLPSLCARAAPAGYSKGFHACWNVSLSNLFFSFSFRASWAKPFAALSLRAQKLNRKNVFLATDCYDASMTSLKKTSFCFSLFSLLCYIRSLKIVFWVKVEKSTLKSNNKTEKLEFSTCMMHLIRLVDTTLINSKNHNPTLNDETTWSKYLAIIRGNIRLPHTGQPCKASLLKTIWLTCPSKVNTTSPMQWYPRYEHMAIHVLPIFEHQEVSQQMQAQSQRKKTEA